jgi:chromosome segregation ATPase
MGSVNIKTGADKLVELVSEKKRVVLDDAAKKLGVGKEVVLEWAEFLEEEGLVTLEYSLSQVFICEKKITRADVLSSAKEVSSEKDALSRRIDVAITTLAHETSGFEDVRREFNTIQKGIKGEIDILKKQLEELERYELLRKGLDKDVSKQRSDYDGFIKDIEDKLHMESQKYDDLKGVIDKERKNLDQYSLKLEELRKLRSDYERTIVSLKASLKNIDSVIFDYKKRFDDSDKTINTYKQSLDNLEKDLSDKKGTFVNKKIVELKANQDKLLKTQSNMEKEISSKTGPMQSYSSISDKIHKSFDGFFSKNISTEKLISEIENDKLDLAKDLEALKSKVTKFTLISTHADMKSRMSDLEDNLKALEKKKSVISVKIEKLVNMIKGK